VVRDDVVGVVNILGKIHGKVRQWHHVSVEEHYVRLWLHAVREPIDAGQVECLVLISELVH
jgi:hypothetical protein